MGGDYRGDGGRVPPEILLGDANATSPTIATFSKNIKLFPF